VTFFAICEFNSILSTACLEQDTSARLQKSGFLKLTNLRVSLNYTTLQNFRNFSTTYCYILTVMGYIAETRRLKSDFVRSCSNWNLFRTDFVVVTKKLEFSTQNKLNIGLYKNAAK